MGFPILGGLLSAASGISAMIRSSQSSSQTSGTTFAPTIPAHQAGDVILVFVAAKGASSGMSVLTAAGWTDRAQDINGGASRWARLALFTLTASGAAHTISIANGSNSNILAHVYVVKDVQGSVTGTAFVGDNPPSHTASWGSSGGLWFAACGGGSAPSGFPFGFIDTLATTSDIGLGTCSKADAVATLDPTAFSTVSDAITITAVVRPL